MFTRKQKHFAFWYQNSSLQENLIKQQRTSFVVHHSASCSIFAEGSSRFSNKDRKNFMIIARGSAFESAAIMEYLLDTSEIQKDVKLEQISKMLFSLIQHLNTK